MGTHLIPRDLKGEGRILTIFSYKALLYTVIGLVIGYIFKFVFSMVKLNTIGLIIMIIFALVGYAIGTFRIPNTSSFKITKRTGGEKIDDVLVRFIKFKMKRNRIYIYTEEEKNRE